MSDSEDAPLPLPEEDSPSSIPVPDAPHPLDEIPIPVNTGNKDLQDEIPLPPDSSKYSPSQHTQEEDEDGMNISPGQCEQVSSTAANNLDKDNNKESSDTKPQSKPVLDKVQAKKRLMAFIPSPKPPVSSSSKSPKGAKGVSVFTPKGGKKKEEEVQKMNIEAIREDETKFKEVMAMNKVLSEKLKQVNNITNDITPVSEQPKPISEPIVSTATVSMKPVPGSAGRNIRRRSESSEKEKSRSPAKRRGRSRSKERDRDKKRITSDERKRERDEDRDRERNRDKGRKRSRSRSPYKSKSRKKSSSPRKKSRSRSRTPKKEIKRSRSRSGSPARPHKSRKDESPTKKRLTSPKIKKRSKSKSPISVNKKDKASTSRSRSRSPSPKKKEKDKDKKKLKRSPSPREEQRRKDDEKSKREDELDKVRMSRMPKNWTEYLKYHYTPHHIKELWQRAEERKNRPSSSPSSDREFSKALEKPGRSIGLSNGKEYPIFLVQRTKTLPPIRYGVNPYCFAGYYKTRKDILDNEEPEVKEAMEQVLRSSAITATVSEGGKGSGNREWFAASQQAFCPPEGKRGVTISHLYSEEGESENSMPLPSPLLVQSSRQSTSVGDSDSAPSPLLKKRYEESPPPTKKMVAKDAKKKRSPSVSSQEEKQRSTKTAKAKTVKEKDKKKEETDESSMEVESDGFVLEKDTVPGPVKLAEEKVKDKKDVERERDTKTKKRKKKKKKKKKKSKRQESSDESSEDEDEDKIKVVQKKSSSKTGDKSKSLAEANVEERLKKHKKSKPEKKRKHSDSESGSDSAIEQEMALKPLKKKSKVSEEESKKKTEKDDKSKRKHRDKSKSKHKKKRSKKKGRSPSSSSSESDEEESSKASDHSDSTPSVHGDSSKKRKDKREKVEKQERNNRSKRSPATSEDDDDEQVPQKGKHDTKSKSKKDKDDDDKEKKPKGDGGRDRDRDGGGPGGGASGAGRGGSERDRDRNGDRGRDRRGDHRSREDKDRYHGRDQKRYSDSGRKRERGGGELEQFLSTLQVGFCEIDLASKPGAKLVSESGQHENNVIFNNAIPKADEMENDGILKIVDGDVLLQSVLDNKEVNVQILLSGQDTTTPKSEVTTTSGIGSSNWSDDSDEEEQAVKTVSHRKCEDDDGALSAILSEPVNPDISLEELLKNATSSEAITSTQGGSKSTTSTSSSSSSSSGSSSDSSSSDDEDDAIQKLHPSVYDPFEEVMSEIVAESKTTDEVLTKVIARPTSPSKSEPEVSQNQPSDTVQMQHPRTDGGRRYKEEEDERRRLGYRDRDRNDKHRNKDRYSDRDRDRRYDDRDRDSRSESYGRRRRRSYSRSPSRSPRSRSRSPSPRYRDRRDRYNRYDDRERRKYDDEGKGSDYRGRDRYYNDRPREPRYPHSRDPYYQEGYDHRTPPDYQSPPIQSNVADSTISDAELAATNMMPLPSIYAVGGDFIPEVPIQYPMHYPPPPMYLGPPTEYGTHEMGMGLEGYGDMSPPRRLSLDERLEMEMGIKLDGPKRTRTYGYNQGPYYHGGQFYPGGSGPPNHFHHHHHLITIEPGVPAVAAQGQQDWTDSGSKEESMKQEQSMDMTSIKAHQERQQCQIVYKGNVVEVVPTEIPNGSFTIHARVEVTANDQDGVSGKRVVTIKVPVVPFAMPVVELPPIEEQRNPMSLHRIKKKKKAEKAKKKRKTHVQTKTQTMKEAQEEEKDESKPSVKDSEGDLTKEDAPKSEVLEATLPSDTGTSESSSADNVPETTEDENSKIRQEYVEEARTEKVLENNEQQTLTTDAGEPANNEVQVNEQRQEIEQKSFKYEAKFPLPEPGKGILVSPGFRELCSTNLAELAKPKKGVKFADGVNPGYGTESSDGEGMRSPPPTSIIEKEKLKLKKLKKKRDRARKKKLAELLDPHDVPPPPSTPFPFCHPGILYQVNPPYAVCYARALADVGFEIVFEATRQVDQLPGTVSIVEINEEMANPTLKVTKNEAVDVPEILGETVDQPSISIPLSTLHQNSNITILTSSTSPPAVKIDMVPEIDGLTSPPRNTNSNSTLAQKLKGSPIPILIRRTNLSPPPIHVFPETDLEGNPLN